MHYKNILSWGVIHKQYVCEFQYMFFPYILNKSFQITDFNEPFQHCKSIEYEVYKIIIKNETTNISFTSIPSMLQIAKLLRINGFAEWFLLHCCTVFKSLMSSLMSGAHIKSHVKSYVKSYVKCSCKMTC